MSRYFAMRLAALALVGLAVNGEIMAEDTAPAKHTIGAAKLIVGELKQTQDFYQQMFGLKEVRRYSSKGVYEEPILGFGDGARLALFAPLAEGPLKKSQYPVALIYTPEFDAVTKRVEDAKQPLRRLSTEAGKARVAITTDPSGNAMEIFERTTAPAAVGGAKLIVKDRAQAESFFTRIFDIQPGQRYTTKAYDEVILNFGGGTFLALFEPKAEAPLPKSQFPVVAIYSSDFDAVVKRVTEAGLGFREVKSADGMKIIVAQDPSGNAIEIISK